MLQLPKEAEGLLGEIKAAGGKGWVVGGALRDMLLGDEPGDWDVAADLTPEGLLAIFPGGRLIGGICGTVLVRYKDVDFEITPCRAEEGYTDKRHPDRVRFVPGILQDLARRDFTVNAMAFDGHVLLDPFDGQTDLRLRQIRCVGRALNRFREDPLRILRMLRFASTLGFAIEEKTAAAAQAEMETVALLPRERVRAEMHRILLGSRPDMLGMLIAGGGLRRYGFYYAPALSALSAVPAGKLCRWWALATLCGVDMRRMGQSFGFSRRFIARMAECGRLFEAGPSDGALALKQKLRGTDLDYGPVSAAFAAVSPVFAGEPEVFLGVQFRREPYRLEDLAVNGSDLAAVGIQGTACGAVLEELLGAVIREPGLNDREKLLVMARSIAGLTPGG